MDLHLDTSTLFPDPDPYDPGSGETFQSVSLLFGPAQAALR